MKIIKREKAFDGGTDYRKDGTKSNVKRPAREEHGREKYGKEEPVSEELGRDADIEEKRRRHEHVDYSDEFYDEEPSEKKEAVNGNSRGGRKRAASRSPESNHAKRPEYDRRNDVKVSRKAVYKRHEIDTPRRYAGRDDSPRVRKGRESDNYISERYNRFGHYEEDRAYYRNGLNGGGRYEEGRRSPHIEDLAERNKRTVFIGNIPMTIKSSKHLLDILGVDEAIVEEARIRPPKNFRYEPELVRNDKKFSQKAYITLKHEKDVKLLLEKDGIAYAGHILKVDMVIHSKHYDREKTVLVKSLSFKVTEGQLFDMFSSFGKVKGYRLIRDRRTNKSLGYGFIYFEDKESVDKAIRVMNGKRVQNRHLIVTAMESDVGHRHPYWNHPNGGIAPRDEEWKKRRFYDYRVRKDISKRDNSYRRK